MSGDLHKGSRLAGYRIDALVGRGGMGVVYSAEQLRLGRKVALKVLAPELVANDVFRQRFDRESRLAALIDHPNIVPVYEAGESEGLLFIAMRWVEGRDLGVLLKVEGPLRLERALHLLGQVASALDAAHEHGLVHRDVKPANILVTRGHGPAPTEHAYLTDFGIAKMAAGAAVTRTGMFLGTPDYASPEQFEGRELDGRADLYALGCLLYQCLTGSRPYERTQELAVMYAHLHDPPPRVTEARGDLPPALDDVIAKAMAKRREDRYASCTEMIEAARAAGQEPAQATVAAGVPTIPPTAAAPTAFASSTELAPPDQPDEGTAAAPPPAPPSETPPSETPPAVSEPAGTAPAARPPAEVPPAPSAPGPRFRRWRWLALGAALVVGAGVAAALVVGSGGDDEGGGATQAVRTQGGTTEAATAPPATEAATADAGSTGPAEEGSETAAPALEASELVWARSESPSLRGGRQGIARMVVTGDGSVVAAGSEGPPRAHDVAFWSTTANGQDVEKQALAAEGDERAFGVTAVGDDGAVAVGYRQPEPPVGETDAAVWVLSGGEWQPATAGLLASDYQKMNRAATGPDGEVVAVGTAGPGYSENGVPLATDAAVWTSNDGGASWTRFDEAAFVKDGYQEMRGITPFDGGFVAVGYDAKDAAVWRSDGDGWREIASQPALAVGGGRVELDMRALAVWEGGLIAVGDVRTSAGDRDGAVWLSSDGETWTLVDVPAFGGTGDQQIQGVVAGAFGIVAVGCSDCDTEASTPVVWTTADGETWTRVGEDQITGVDGAQQMSSVVDAGGSLLAGGWAQTDAGLDAALWAAPLG